MLHIGFAVRLLYFLLAPFTVLSAGDVIPMTGVLINIIVLVGGFIAVELLRDATGRHPLIARVLARQAPQLHRHAPIAQPHLGAIARLARAMGTGQPPDAALTEARRCFAWTPLPGAWGEAVGAAWAHLDAAFDAIR